MVVPQGAEAIHRGLGLAVWPSLTPPPPKLPCCVPEAAEYGAAYCTVSIWMLVLQVKAIVWVRSKIYTVSTGISQTCGVFSRCYSSGPLTLLHKRCWRGLPNHSVAHSLASSMLLLLMEQLGFMVCLYWNDQSWTRFYVIIPVMSGYSVFQLVEANHHLHYKFKINCEALPLGTAPLFYEGK